MNKPIFTSVKRLRGTDLFKLQGIYPIKVIYNNPATIVFFNDGTKSVVHCGEKEKYDAEKGLFAAILKRLSGGGSFNEIYKQFPYVKPKKVNNKG